MSATNNRKMLTIERLCGSPDLQGSALGGLKLSPDGKTVSYIKGREANKEYFDLWGMEVGTQKHKLLVD